MPEDLEFPIPPPPPTDIADPSTQISLSVAALEQRQLSSFFSPQLHEHYDWILHFCLKPVLFLFVLGLNIWWDVNVRKMIWESGRANSGFHLSDTALVALITTSMANFLALVAIVAKNLFPGSDISKRANH